MYCNCSKDGIYRDKNPYRQVEVDSDGVCQNCGYYAVKNPIRINDLNIEGEIQSEDDFKKLMLKSDATIKDYVLKHSKESPCKKLDSV